MSNVFYLSDLQGREPTNTAGSSNADDRPTLGQRAPLGLQRLGDAIAARERFVAVRARLLPPPPDKNPLGRAVPILLYHVSYGRNAWHSTWIARYQRNTLAHSYDAAKAFVAERLKQGSSYRLAVTPGWHLQFDRRAYLVCEINSSAPFSRLRSARFASEGVMEAEALEMLKPSSELWRGATPLHDSIVVQETSRPAGDYVKWEDRTSHPAQVRTPGRYQRAIDGKHWWFRAVNGDASPDFDTSAFAALVAGIHDVNTSESQ
jgi:hypothetical protein